MQHSLNAMALVWTAAHAYMFQLGRVAGMCYAAAVREALARVKQTNFLVTQCHLSQAVACGHPSCTRGRSSTTSKSSARCSGSNCSRRRVGGLKACGQNCATTGQLPPQKSSIYVF